MKKSEIKVGGLYLANVSSEGTVTTVRVDTIEEYAGGRVTHYNVTEVATGRDVSLHFPNARNFRCEVSNE